MNARCLCLVAVCAGLGWSCAVDVRDAREIGGDVEALDLQASAREPEGDSARASDALTTDRPDPPRTTIVSCEDPCVMGGPHQGCGDPCSNAMAFYDSYCVQVAWDELCVQNAMFLCGAACGCTHPLDERGLAQLFLDSCECAATVCRIDYFCCNTAWDRQCADQAKAQCAAW